MKFSVIVCDPPYGFFDKLEQSDVKRGAAANYSTMTISKIKEMRVNDIADPDGAILCLWVPSSLLQDGLGIMKAWGFNHKQTYIWVKSKKDIFSSFKTYFYKSIKKFLKDGNFDDLHLPDIKDIFYKTTTDVSLNNMLSFGMGRLFRNCHEICLIGTNNNKIYKKLANKSQRTVSLAPNLKHSAKPGNLQDSLDIMFPNVNKIELFARCARSGWITLGNQCPSSLGEDINDSIAKLI